MTTYPFFWADMCFVLGILTLTLALSIMYKITKLKRYMITTFILVTFLFYWLNQDVTIVTYIPYENF